MRHPSCLQKGGKLSQMVVASAGINVLNGISLQTQLKAEATVNGQHGLRWTSPLQRGERSVECGGYSFDLAERLLCG